ncbi:MAG: hypothetical protein WC332_02200 [Clostridia bacterium]|jgi:hypothetical protein
MKNYKKIEAEENKKEAIKNIKKILRAGDTVHCICRHVSSSGMMRRLSFYAIKKNKLICLDWYINRIMDIYPHDRNNAGLRVSGCGMDMGFSVVYNLGKTIWPKGTPKPHGNRNGKPDSDGGYALKHSWM